MYIITLKIVFFIQLIFHLSVDIYGYSLPKIWNHVTYPFKNKARNWFIGRAETLGIPWKKLTNYYKSNDAELLANKVELQDLNIEYPDYYTKPFHGYDKGNLNWLAAYENVAATLNIAAGYWPDSDVYVAQNWMRYNTTQVIEDYFKCYRFSGYDPSYEYCDENDSDISDKNHNGKGENYDFCDTPRRILDIGCSIGISTEYLQGVFPKAHVIGLDLSPYFLSIAQFRNHLNGTGIEYVHANAEYTPFDSQSFDLVTCNYLFHELPCEATNKILGEINRILKPNGVIAITDLEPQVVNSNTTNLLTPFRRWMFEVTEPHIFSYYEQDMKLQLSYKGFTSIVKSKNDPVNSVWIGKKFGG